MPRIVFCDMDGTFLAADKSIPERNLQALDALHEAGVPFVPCSGRSFEAIPPEVRTHPASAYVIACNGALVCETDGTVLRRRPMDTEAVLSLYEKVKGLPITFDVFADGVIWSERARYDVMDDMHIDPGTLGMLKRMRHPTDLTVPEVIAKHGQVDKVTCFFGSSADMATVRRLVDEDPTMWGTSGARGNIEIMATGVSKGDAVTWLCDRLDIPVDVAAGVGDSPNDREMLVACGVGVAVANAVTETMQVADVVCPSGDEGGVGVYLHSFLTR